MLLHCQLGSGSGLIIVLLHCHLQVMHNFLPSAVKFHYQVRVGGGRLLLANGGQTLVLGHVHSM